MRTRIIRALAVMAGVGMSAGFIPAAQAADAVTGQQGARPATSCGVWRWPVKTGADHDRYKVSKTVIYTSIRYLRTRIAPPSFPAYYQDHRFRGAERHIYQLDDTRLTAFRLEDDGDIHLILKNDSGKRMITEIPKPACVSHSSLWQNAIAAARATFASHYQVTTSWQDVNRRINIRGLGFFDKLHGQSGVAPNGIELHPVTRIRFRLGVAPGSAAAPRRPLQMRASDRARRKRCTRPCTRFSFRWTTRTGHSTECRRPSGSSPPFPS